MEDARTALGGGRRRDAKLHLAMQSRGSVDSGRYWLSFFFFRNKLKRTGGLVRIQLEDRLQF